MLNGFLKASRPPNVSNELKSTNEKVTWNTQDTNLSSYVLNANVDHTITGEGTAISALKHSATTPRGSWYSINTDTMWCTLFHQIYITQKHVNNDSTWTPHAIKLTINICMVLK